MTRLAHTLLSALRWTIIGYAFSSGSQAAEIATTSKLSLSTATSCGQKEQAVLVVGQLTYTTVEGGIWFIKTANNRYQVGRHFSPEMPKTIMALVCRQSTHATTAMVGQPVRLLSWHLFGSRASGNIKQLAL